ncbi:MAG: alpha-ribazole kinase [Desulfitobacteriaceae bacterium]|nr:alpha-ribazole kinase [Desulfitobacteriaceae bacterium]MDI6879959.1 alpha-ribazole kinase [Desulfitobacteriaceae bacterium]MDI6914794.1 alpha-ribazole kinase [Desulfitobacteriaceae bacterium]
MGYKGRDVEVVWLSEDRCLIVACDSSGAIGEKEEDVVKVPPEVVGRFATRVALLEVMATGGYPQVLTVAISNEPVPTGEGILRGVREELRSLGLGSLAVAISTEKNIPTQQTGLGVGVTGTADSETLRIARSQAGDIMYCLGIPKVGVEVESPEDPEIVQGRDVLELLHQVQVHDLVPVGSRGIRSEAESLAESVGCIFEGIACSLDMQKSAGPSTCLIVTTPMGFRLEEGLRSSLAVTCIGRLN